MLAAVLQAIVTAWPTFVGFVVLLAMALVVALYRVRRLARSGIAAIDQMDGRTFEHRLALLLTRLGYKVEETPYSGDYGADLIVSKDGTRIAVQAKRANRSIGVKAIQEVVSAKDFYRCTGSMVVTNRTYTAQARTLGEATGTELWDRRTLIATLLATSGAPAPMGGAPSALTTGRANLRPTCGKSLSAKVLAFCLAHPERFGGHGYCFEHQRSVQSIDSVATGSWLTGPERQQMSRLS
jgi:restriction system protein